MRSSNLIDEDNNRSILPTGSIDLQSERAALRQEGVSAAVQASQAQAKQHQQQEQNFSTGSTLSNSGYADSTGLDNASSRSVVGASGVLGNASGQTFGSDDYQQQQQQYRQTQQHTTGYGGTDYAGDNSTSNAGFNPASYGSSTAQNDTYTARSGQQGLSNVSGDLLARSSAQPIGRGSDAQDTIQDILSYGQPGSNSTTGGNTATGFSSSGLDSYDSGLNNNTARGTSADQYAESGLAGQAGFGAHGHTGQGRGQGQDYAQGQTTGFAASNRFDDQLPGQGQGYGHLPGQGQQPGQGQSFGESQYGSSTSQNAGQQYNDDYRT